MHWGKYGILEKKCVKICKGFYRKLLAFYEQVQKIC